MKMGFKLMMILGLLAISMAAEAANASVFLTKSCENGSGGCIGDNEEIEMLMESETSHRMLAQKGRYISYGAMKANNVPCNRRGKSYYNCQKRGRANPYKRGCSAATRCHRYTS